MPICRVETVVSRFFPCAVRFWQTCTWELRRGRSCRPWVRVHSGACLPPVFPAVVPRREGPSLCCGLSRASWSFPLCIAPPCACGPCAPLSGGVARAVFRCDLSAAPSPSRPGARTCARTCARTGCQSHRRRAASRAHRIFSPRCWARPLCMRSWVTISRILKWLILKIL